MKIYTYALFAYLIAAIFGVGCIAIPMGKETFTTEYPTAIRATWDSPAKTYEPSVSVVDGDKDRHTASIALHAGVTSEQPQEQQYESLTVEKGKRLAFGVMPRWAEHNFQPKNALIPLPDWNYEGNGKYQRWARSDDLLSEFLLGILWLPNTLLIEPLFGDYECDTHHWLDGNDGKKTLLLSKFSEEDRKRIGAWTWRDQDNHPQNGGSSLFTHLGAFGFHKYCTYVVKDPVLSPKRTPVAPKVERSRRTVRGPYTATLSLPALGYRETVAVEPGKTNAVFRLLDAANGDAMAKGTVRFALPVEGEKAVASADDREILKLAAKREWPVTVALPAPRAERVAGVSPDPEATKSPKYYKVKSIERPESGGLVVRVSVDDTAKTLEVDREVQPEIRRMFREQFATGDNANRRENLSMERTDGGRTLVYTVVFE